MTASRDAADPGEGSAAHPVPREPRARAALPALLGCVVALALLAPALVAPGGLLARHPAAFPTLAGEDPGRAALARSTLNHTAGDALFPIQSDARVLRAALRAGRAPLWDPALGLGQPTAGGMVPWTYPPNALHAVLAPGRAQAWLAWLGLVVATLGLERLLAQGGVRTPARAVGVLALVAGGWAVWNAPLAPRLHAAAWLPAALLGVERCAAGRRGGAALAALATALALSAGYLAVGALVPVAAGALALARRSPRALLGIAAGLLLAAPTLAPTLEARAHAARPPAVARAAESAALPRPALLTLFAPGAFGLATDDLEPGRSPAGWWFCRDADDAARANAREWNVFAGVGVASLAAAGLVGAPLRALVPLILLAVTWLYAFGAGPGRWLYAVPGLDEGAPTRALALAWPAWAWLAALGAEALLGPRRRIAATGALSVAFVAGVLGSGLSRSIEPRAYAAGMQERVAGWHDLSPGDVAALLPPAAGEAAAARLGGEGEVLLLVAFVALAAALLALVLRRPRPALLLAPWALLILAEGGRLARDTLAPCAIGGSYPPASEQLDALARGPGPGPARVARLAGPGGEAPDVPRNLPTLYGAADLAPTSLSTPRTFVELAAALAPAGVLPWRAPDALAPAAPGAPAFARLDAAWLLEAGAEGPRWRASPGAPRRCWLATTALPPPADPSALSERPAVVHLAGARAEASAAPPTTASIRWARPVPERFEATVEGAPEGGAWLVVAEQWYPGWRATVDGAPAEVLRADHALRAVRVPGGDSAVVMRYAPATRQLGRAGLGLGALLLLLGRRRRAAEGRP